MKRTIVALMLAVTACSSPVEKKTIAPGWSAEKLAAAREYSESIGSAAVVIVQDGVVIDSWGDDAEPVDIRSIRKALLGALIGRAVAKGQISLDATLADLGIDEKTPLTAQEKTATVRDLLTSSSGITLPAAREAGDDRPPRGSVPRGKFFYNNWDFNALGTIYERAAGRSLFAAFHDEIAKPLGMEDFTLDDTRSMAEDVSIHPAYAFDMSARDLAKFGTLYARGGGSVVPAEWIRESFRAHRTTDREPLKYGYLWWVDEQRGGAMSTGNGGQFLWVEPQRKLVIVHLANTSYMLARRALRMHITNAEREKLLAMILEAAPRARP